MAPPIRLVCASPHTPALVKFLRSVGLRVLSFNVRDFRFPVVDHENYVLVAGDNDVSLPGFETVQIRYQVDGHAGVWLVNRSKNARWPESLKGVASNVLHLEGDTFTPEHSDQLFEVRYAGLSALVVANFAPRDEMKAFVFEIEVLHGAAAPTRDAAPGVQSAGPSQLTAPSPSETTPSGKTTPKTAPLRMFIHGPEGSRAEELCRAIATVLPHAAVSKTVDHYVGFETRNIDVLINAAPTQPVAPQLKLVETRDTKPVAAKNGLLRLWFVISDDKSNAAIDAICERLGSCGGKKAMLLTDSVLWKRPDFVQQMLAQDAHIVVRSAFGPQITWSAEINWFVVGGATAPTPGQRALKEAFGDLVDVIDPDFQTVLGNFMLLPNTQKKHAYVTESMGKTAHAMQGMTLATPGNGATTPDDMPDFVPLTETRLEEKNQSSSVGVATASKKRVFTVTVDVPQAELSTCSDRSVPEWVKDVVKAMYNLRPEEAEVVVVCPHLERRLEMPGAKLRISEVM